MPSPAQINEALGKVPQRKRPPSIAVPTLDVRSLHTTVEQIKEAVEVMHGQRGVDRLQEVVRWRDLVDLGLIAANQVPK